MIHRPSEVHTVVRRRQGKARVSVLDVADEAGVSVATVSRAFNLPDVVSDDVRERVLDVAKRLGYSPNAAARALRSRKTHIVGALIPSLDYAIYARMVNAFQQSLSGHGYMTIVLTTGFDNRKIFDKVKLLVERGAEALVLVGAIEDPELREYLKDSALPTVTTYSHLPNEIVPSIGFDNARAVEQMVDHLADFGHREFAMVSSISDGNDRQRARISGYQTAIKRRRLLGGDRIFAHPYSIEDGAAALREIHKACPQATAIVCTSDVHAFGVLSECRRLGLRVPEDVSVTGYDDADYAARLYPSLTTISVPADEMGVAAASALHRALTKNRKPVGVQLETRLIVRESSGHEGALGSEGRTKRPSTIRSAAPS
jgi:LacI family transcriptional regulator